MIHTLFFHFRTLMFVGILTNLSVCWVVVRNSQARTARNLFIINMAFSDLTVCCITMPATVMKLINHTWKYGDLLCRLTRYILFIFINNFRVVEFHPLYKTQEIKYWKNWYLGPLSCIEAPRQRYTYRVLQTIQMKLILLCVWAELAILGSTKNAQKFKYEIWIG